MTQGCYNRPPLHETIVVQDGWSTSYAGFGDEPVLGTAYSRRPRMIVIANANSNECQYSLTAADPGCDGCVWNRAGQLNQEAS